MKTRIMVMYNRGTEKVVCRFACGNVEKTDEHKNFMLQNVGN